MLDGDVDQRLRAYLLAGDFGTQGRLPAERELVQALGISRPALREALKTLQALGLIEVRRGDGAYLSSLEFNDLLAVRERLEPLAARLVAAGRTADHVEGLRNAVEKLRTSIDDPVAFAAADEQVHRIIAEACGNFVLRRILEMLGEMVRFARRTAVQNPRLRADTLSDVRDLVEQVIAGRPAKAEAAMRRHLERLATAPTHRRESRAA